MVKRQATDGDPAVTARVGSVAVTGMSTDRRLQRDPQVEEQRIALEAIFGIGCI